MVERRRSRRNLELAAKVQHRLPMLLGRIHRLLDTSREHRRDGEDHGAVAIANVGFRALRIVAAGSPLTGGSLYSVSAHGNGPTCAHEK